MPWLMILSIIIDQSFEFVFVISSNILCGWIDFSSSIYSINFAVLPLLLFMFFFIFCYFCYNNSSNSFNFYFINFFSFLFINQSFFNYFIFLYQFLIFYIKGPIYIIEVYTGLNIYSIFLYYSLVLVVLFFVFIFLFVLVLI